MPCIFLTSANKKNLFSFKTRPGHDVFCKDTETFFFLSALSLRRTSKDQHFHPCIETKLPQNLDKKINSLLISTKYFLPKNSFQKILPKNSKQLPNNFSISFSDFENIQFPSSHLEAENPFGLGFFLYF